MTSVLRLRFSHTHIYPGATGRTEARLPARGETPCLVEFSDGVEVPARLTLAGNAHCLGVEAYSTARGTSVPAKRWRLEAGAGEDAAKTLRVISRAVDPS